METIKSDYKIIELNNEYEVEKRIYWIDDNILINKEVCPTCGRKIK